MHSSAIGDILRTCGFHVVKVQILCFALPQGDRHRRLRFCDPDRVNIGAEIG
jgi:hypothetical protein